MTDPISPEKKIVAAYDYRDESGTLLYQVVRFEPKDFRQRVPDGKGWRYSLNGTRRVLYRLPELLASDCIVRVVEGEKDADRLASLGLTATTAAMGAGKWLAEYCEVLRGRHVVIIPDNDEPGRKHAEAVRKALSGIAASVVILELPDLPPKGDVSKWLDAGNDKGKLLELAQQAEARVEFHNQTDKRGATDESAPVSGPPPNPFGVPKPASQLVLADPTRTWLWQGYLARGAITLLSSIWKVGKTTLLSHLLKSMERGGHFCGKDVAAAKVLYVTEESEGRWAKRRDELGLADHCTFLVRPFMGRPDPPAWYEFLAWVADYQREQPADLIVFDTLPALWPVRDENDAAHVQAAVAPLHRLTGQAALLLTHHLRKGDGQEGTASRGSGALLGFVDCILELRRFDAGNRQDRRRMLSGYSRDEETPAELVLELTDGDGYCAHGDRDQVNTLALRTMIARTLPNESPGWTWEELREHWPDDPAPRKQRLLDALAAGADSGEWHREGKGVKGAPFRFWIPAP
jgi:hypothetical protein